MNLFRMHKCIQNYTTDMKVAHNAIAIRIHN